MKEDRPAPEPPTVERHPLPVLGDPRDVHAHEHADDHDHGDLFTAAAAVTPAEGEHGYGPTYWRSIEEKLGDPAFLASLDREFPEGATEAPQGVARRDFLQLLGASLALAGLNACTSRPQEKVLPYTRNPVDIHPSNPLHYATADVLHGYGAGLLVTSWEGRPTKVDGNPDHPATSKGASSVFEQALVLQLYDPDRARQLRHERTPLTWRGFLTRIAERARALETDGGSRLRFLLEPSASPLLENLRGRILQRFPKARFHAYEAVSRQNVYDGARMAFGTVVEPLYELAGADVIVSLDADILHPETTTLRHTRAFGDRRDPANGPLNRLYVVESRLSITGSVADHRLRIRSADVHGFALALWDALNDAPGRRRPRTAPFAEGELARWVQAVSRDLRAHAGRSLVVAGKRQPPVVHAIAHAINERLGNVGRTVTYVRPGLHDVETGPGSLGALAADIEAGQVDTLVITAWNPAYAAPADVNLAALLERRNARGQRLVHSVYHGLYEDETAARCEWFVPAAHPLESWGDTRAIDGTVSLIQPLIAPLFNGVTEVDLLAAFVGEGDRGAHALLKDFWRARASSTTFELDWESWLAKGVVPGPTAEPVTARLADGAAQAIETASAGPAPQGLEISFVESYKVHDGRFANNAWLQELPGPMTKMVWDNAALVSPKTATQLGVVDGDVVKLEDGERALLAPILILPGHAEGSISLPLGYGRDGTERVARGVGFNAYALRRSNAPWFDVGVKLTKAPRRHEFAITQGHWSMRATDRSRERPLALEQDLAEYEGAPGALTEALRKANPTLQDPVKYEGYQWAMAVDLSRCIGCNACVVACQSENNIPVVGKEQVKRGREMHWLRIDRYFRGEIDSPAVITQPVACVHCEAAPCEYVCPVNATVHNDEGLNEMVYNRCIGTRYCSNNCPYKVRRFNYLRYTANRTALERMQHNPDVTVRARGVMEKCTYCVQRIERTRIDARVSGREIRDGELRTACQEACPTGTIVFGTLSDPQSMVSKLHREHRRYDLLHELNTRPRTGYLVRIKNPNPELG